jgi:hypothetical protein
MDQAGHLPNHAKSPPPGTPLEDAQAISPRERIVRWIRLSTIAAFAISVLIHLILWLIASLLSIEIYGRGVPAPSQGEEVEFAVLTEQEFAQIQASELAEQTPVVPDTETAPASTLSLELLDASTLGGLTDLTSDLGSVSTTLGAGDVGKSSSLASGGSGSGTSFFGLEAKGNRIAYIVDMSGSMALEGKWNRTSEELIASIEELPETASFIVGLFSGDVFPLENKREWTEADTRAKRWVRTVIARVSPNGATYPTPAFHLMFSIRPRPDAIYFMTDGEFSANVVDEVLAINRDLQIPIHCITFVSREAEQHMQRLARESGGSYIHVPGVAP